MVFIDDRTTRNSCSSDPLQIMPSISKSATLNYSLSNMETLQNRIVMEPTRLLFNCKILLDSLYSLYLVLLIIIIIKKNY